MGSPVLPVRLRRECFGPGGKIAKFPTVLKCQLFINPIGGLFQFVDRACQRSQIEHIMNIVIMEADMREGLEPPSVRDERGRFVPGQSGNPGGKAPGTRNRATLLRAALDGEDGSAMARVIIDKAVAGDVVTARFCLDRLEPRPRSRAITIDLPEDACARDVLAVYDATVQAMMGVLEGRRRAIEAAWREDKLALVEPRAEPSPASSRRSSATPDATAGSFGPRASGRGGLPADLLHSTCIARRAPGFDQIVQRGQTWSDLPLVPACMPTRKSYSFVPDIGSG